MQRSLLLAAVLITVSIFITGCSGSDPKPEQITESVLIDKIAKSTGITRNQAQIGLSALMILSEEKLSADEFAKLTTELPGGAGLLNFAADLGFTPGSIKTQADIVQILVNLGVNPVDAGKFLTSVLSVSKNIEGGAFGLLSKVYENR